MSTAAEIVTVLIPCRDQGRVLEDAVDSVFAQTHGGTEIVVVDDGSSDPFTRRVLERYDWPRTRVLRQERPDAAAARALALNAARGRYVCVLEAPDRLAPRYLEAAIGALQAGPAAAFATAPWSVFGTLGFEIRPRAADVVSVLAGLIHPSFVARTDAVRAVGGFDVTLTDGADADLALRLLASGAPAVMLADVLLFRRLDPRVAANAAALGLPPSLLGKHDALYREHARDVVTRRDELLLRILSPDGDGSSPASWPEDVRRLEDARQRIQELEAGLADARFQVAHLRASLSWRLTEPVRALVRLLTRERPASADSTSPAAAMPPTPLDPRP